MINTITVIGSGLMGSSIAAHLSNADCKVYLLDIVLNSEKNRNYLADKALKKLLKMKPNPLTLYSNIKKITIGNIEDDLDFINNSDWVIEAIVEDLDIKKKLYKKIDKIVNDKIIISSNTSTIPIKQLTEGMSKKFKKNFLITHFFNPPRYLKLLEIVKSDQTSLFIKDNIINFCDIKLGKSVIETKDTPGFIGNRIGIFWIERAAVEALEHGLSVEEADAIIIGIFKVPKTGVFGLIDVVGLDLMPAVIKSLLKNIPKDDLFHSVHKSPEIFSYMLKNNLIGRKAEGGFYKLEKKEGKSIKYSLNLKDKKYYLSKRMKIEGLKSSNKNLLKFFNKNNNYSNYALKILSDIICYVLNIAEEIAHDIYSIDEAMKYGFGWQYGPFEIIDNIGVSVFKDLLLKQNIKIPKLLSLIENNSFYKIENNNIYFFDFNKNLYEKFKRQEGVILLSDIKKTSKPINKCSTASLWNIGDGVTVFEIHSKGNSIDMATMEFLNKSIDVVESSYKAMIIYNEGEFFSAGANLGEALFMGNIGLDNELDKNILTKGQQVYTKLKYSKFPVISAPFNLTLGGGCEIILQSDFVQAHIESYIGLTEAALGILPAWGGCKEMLARFKNDKSSPKGPMPAILKTFELIGKAKVSSSAHEAKKFGYLRDSDGITMNRNRLLYDSKIKALNLMKSYTPPEKIIFNLPGETAFSTMKLILNNMHSTGQISNHDKFVGENIAKVLSGGDTNINIELKEELILKLEKNAIYNLFKENLTLERLEHVLETGKYLRN